MSTQRRAFFLGGIPWYSVASDTGGSEEAMYEASSFPTGPSDAPVSAGLRFSVEMRPLVMVSAF